MQIVLLAFQRRQQLVELVGHVIERAFGLLNFGWGVMCEWQPNRKIGLLECLRRLLQIVQAAQINLEHAMQHEADQ